jgi:hypothetical protein
MKLYERRKLKEAGIKPTHENKKNRKIKESYFKYSNKESYKLQGLILVPQMAQYTYDCAECGINFCDEQPELDHCLVCGADFNQMVKGKLIEDKKE